MYNLIYSRKVMRLYSNSANIIGTGLNSLQIVANILQ